MVLSNNILIYALKHLKNNYLYTLYDGKGKKD